MAAASSGDGRPVFPDGAISFQNRLWFQCPPALLRTALGRVDIVANISSIDLPRRAGSASTALFRLST